MSADSCSELVYVPQGLVETHRGLFPETEQHHITVCSVEVGARVPMLVPVYAVQRGEVDALNKFLETISFGDVVRKIPVPSCGEQDTIREIHGIFLGTESSFDNEEVEEELERGITFFSCLFSALSHRVVTFESERRAGCIPPVSSKVMRFMYGTPDTLDRAECKASEIFGCSLHPVLGREVTYPGPYFGRGVIHTDTAGTPVAQTIGGMTHIFSSTQHCNQKEALTIILCAMVVAWNDMVMGREALPSGEQVLESNASKLLEVHAETLYETTQKAIADCEEDIERRKHRLISRMRDLVALRALSKEYKRYAASDADALLRDVQSLRRIPGVDDVRITDGCLELHSNDVVIEHKGKQHHLGRYTLRFTKALYPLVYAQTTLHPQGVMHPHIGPSGAVCFGNVTYAITEAAADYNYVRVAELVFGWLFNGYDEAIAETPVTEWPEVKQEGETADALAA